MLDLIETIKKCCEIAGLEYKEHVCDCGQWSGDKESDMVTIKDGGYRASVLLNGVEQVYGFTPIPAEGITESVKENTRFSLVLSLLLKATKP